MEEGGRRKKEMTRIYEGGQKRKGLGEEEI